ncbi:MAG TPA: 50S ribosomal protein L3 [Candidatus Saccharimonadales bacterium]|nr:50S ribosomal protein L3 [Candidatus Saccharimonadales bacterium]
MTRKIGMTSIISDDGSALAVTLLSAGENTVTQIKSEETDGYAAVQLGTENNKKLAKAQVGHVKKTGTKPNVMREVRVTELGEIKVGDKYGADLFSTGDIVDASSTSKGKGFAGAIKRHNFSRQRKSHGAKGATRRVGSIGSMYPQKIFKGKKMPGHMGHDKTTVKNLKIALVDQEKNVIGVFGAVPGPKKSLVILKGVK